MEVSCGVLIKHTKYNTIERVQRSFTQSLYGMQSLSSDLVCIPSKGVENGRSQSIFGE